METLRAYLEAKRLAIQANATNTRLEIARLDSYGIASIDRWRKINHAQRRAFTRYLRRDRAALVAYHAMRESIK